MDSGHSSKRLQVKQSHKKENNQGKNDESQKENKDYFRFIIRHRRRRQLLHLLLEQEDASLVLIVIDLSQLLPALNDNNLLGGSQALVNGLLTLHHVSNEGRHDVLEGGLFSVRKAGHHVLEHGNESRRHEGKVGRGDAKGHVLLTELHHALGECLVIFLHEGDCRFDHAHQERRVHGETLALEQFITMRVNVNGKAKEDLDLGLRLEQPVVSLSVIREDGKIASNIMRKAVILDSRTTTTMTKK